VGETVAILGLTFFVVSVAFGTCISPSTSHLLISTVFSGPLSEFYGRKRVYIISYIFFISIVNSGKAS